MTYADSRFDRFLNTRYLPAKLIAIFVSLVMVFSMSNLTAFASEPGGGDDSGYTEETEGQLGYPGDGSNGGSTATDDPADVVKPLRVTEEEFDISRSAGEEGQEPEEQFTPQPTYVTLHDLNKNTNVWWAHNGQGGEFKLLKDPADTSNTVPFILPMDDMVDQDVEIQLYFAPENGYYEMPSIRFATTSGNFGQPAQEMGLAPIGTADGTFEWATDATQQAIAAGAKYQASFTNETLKKGAQTNGTWNYLNLMGTSYPINVNVAYNANGGKVYGLDGVTEVENAFVDSNDYNHSNVLATASTITVPTAVPQKDGARFQYWRMADTGITCAPGAQISVDALWPQIINKAVFNTQTNRALINLSFDAVYDDAPSSSYYVTYNANGAVDTNPVAAQQTDAQGKVTIASCSWSMDKYDFVEWNTEANGTGTQYMPGTTVALDADLELYAIWTLHDAVTINYATEGEGTISLTQEKFSADDTTYVVAGSYASPSVGYKFDGWYMQVSGNYGSEGQQLVSSSQQLVFGSEEGQVSVEWAANVTYTFTAKFVVDEESTNLINANVVYMGTSSLGQYAADIVLNENGTSDPIFQNVPVAGPQYIDLTKVQLEQFEGYEAEPARIVVGSETYYSLENAVVPNGAMVYIYMMPDTGNAAKTDVSYTVNYHFQEYGTNDYTQDETLTITVPGRAWINETYKQLPIAEGGIPQPYVTSTDEDGTTYAYPGYIPRAEQSFPQGGTMVDDGTVFDVYYDVDLSQTQTAYLTVKHLVQKATVDPNTFDVTALLDEEYVSETTYEQQVWANLKQPVFYLEQRADEYVVDVAGYSADPSNMSVELPDGVAELPKHISSYLKDEAVPSGAVITQRYSANKDTKTSGIEVHYVLGNDLQEDETLEIFKTKWAGDPSIGYVDITAADNVEKTFRGYKDPSCIAVCDGEEVEFDGTGSLPHGTVVTYTYVPDYDQTLPSQYIVHHMYDGVQLHSTTPFASSYWVGAAVPYVTILEDPEHNSYPLDLIEEDGYYCTADKVAVSPAVEYGQRVYISEIEDGVEVPTAHIYIFYSSDPESRILSYTVSNYIEGLEGLDGPGILVSQQEYTGLYNPNSPKMVLINEGVTPENEAPFDFTEMGYKYNNMTEARPGTYVPANTEIVYFYQRDYDADANKAELSFDINYYGFSSAEDAAGHDYSNAKKLSDTVLTNRTAWQGKIYDPEEQEWIDHVPYATLDNAMLTYDDHYGYKFDRIEVKEFNGATTTVLQPEGEEAIDLTDTYRIYGDASINVIYAPDMSVTRPAKYTVKYKGLVSTDGENNPVYVDLATPAEMYSDVWVYDNDAKVEVQNDIYTEGDTFDFIANSEYWTLQMTDEQIAALPEAGTMVDENSEYVLYFVPNTEDDPYVASYTVVHEGTYKEATTTFDSLEITQEQAFWGLTDDVNISVTSDSLKVDNSSSSRAATYGYEFDCYEYNGQTYATKAAFLEANPTVPEGAVIKVLYKGANIVTNFTVTVSYTYGERVMVYDEPTEGTNTGNSNYPVEDPDVNDYMPPTVTDDEGNANVTETVGRMEFVPYGADSDYPPVVKTLTVAAHPLDKDNVTFDISNYPEKDLTDQGWVIDSRYYASVGQPGVDTPVPTTIYAGQYVSYNYVKRSDLSYTVQHIDWNKRNDADGGIMDEQTYTNQVFDTKITENDVPALAIYGYDFDAEKSADTRTLTIGIDNDANVIKLYYMPRADLTYIVRCYQQGSSENPETTGFYNLLLDSRVDNQAYMDTITVDAPAIDGYRVNGASSQDITLTSIEEFGNIVNFYYDLITDIIVKVNYYEVGADGTVSAAPVRTYDFGPRYFGEKDTTVYGSYYMTDRDMVGYTLLTENPVTQEPYADAFTFATLPSNPEPVNFYVKRASDLTYTVKVVNTEGEALVDDIQMDGVSFGDRLTAAEVAELISADLPEKLENYTFVGGDADEYVIGMEDNVITLTYSKNGQLSYAVKYVSKKNGNTYNIADTVYVTTFTEGEGDDAQVRELYAGDVVSFSTENAPKVVGYNVKSVDKDQLTVSTDGDSNVVTFTYEPITGITVKVHHRDNDNQTRVLTENMLVKDNTFGDAVTFDVKAVEGYSLLVGDGAAKVKLANGDYAPINLVYNNFNATGTIDIDAAAYNEAGNCVDVYLYYELRKDVSYTINYIEVDPADPSIMLGQLGQVQYDGRTHGTKVDIVYDAALKKYEIQENGESITPDPAYLKEFDGYTLLKDRNGFEVVPSGMWAQSNTINSIDVKLVKRADCEYTLRYGKLDASGEFVPFIDDETITGVEFGKVVSAPVKSFQGYNLDGYSTNAPNGSITVGADSSKNVITAYYTARTDLMYTIHLVDQTNKKVKSLLPVKGYYGQPVTVTAPAAPKNYTYVTEPEPQDIVLGHTTDEAGNDVFVNNIDVFFPVKAKDDCVITINVKVGDKTFTYTLNDGIYGHNMDADAYAALVKGMLADDLKGFEYGNRYEYASTHSASGNYDSDEYKSLIGANGNSVTLTFIPMENCTYTVHYKDSADPDGDDLRTSDSLTAPFGDDITLVNEKIRGFVPNADNVYDVTIDEESCEFTLYYDRMENLTVYVKYMYYNDENQLVEFEGSAKTFGGDYKYNVGVPGSTFEKEFAGYVLQESLTSPALAEDGMFYPGETGHQPGDDVTDNTLTYIYAPNDQLTYAIWYVCGDDKIVVPGGTCTYGDSIPVRADVPAGYKLAEGEQAEKTLEVKADSNENVVVFNVEKRSDLSYTINYVEAMHQDNVLKAATTVRDQELGATVTTTDAWEAAGQPKIVLVYNEDGNIKQAYTFRSYSTNQFTITADSSNNVITFFYDPMPPLNYTIRYVGTRNVDGQEQTTILRPNNGTAAYGTPIKMTAPSVFEGWKLDDDPDVNFDLTENNTVYIVNYVPRDDIEYTVTYVNPKGDILKTATGTGTYMETIEVTPNLSGVDGYVCETASDQVTLENFNGNNSVQFLCFPRTDYTYTVTYQDPSNNPVGSGSVTVEGLTFGEPYTFTAPAITGYHTPASQTIIVGKEELKPFIYRPVTDCKYTVYYREAGTNGAIATPKTVENCTFNSTIEERAIAINGYTLTTNNATQRLTITTGENILTFYYTRNQQNAVSGGNTGYTGGGTTTGGYTGGTTTGGTTVTTPNPAGTANPYNYTTNYYNYTTNPSTTVNPEGLTVGGDGYEVIADGVNATASGAERMSTDDRPDSSTYSTRTQTIDDEENPLAAAAKPGSEGGMSSWYWQYTVGALIIAAAIAYGIYVFFRRYGSIREMEEIEDSLL